MSCLNISFLLHWKEHLVYYLKHFSFSLGDVLRGVGACSPHSLEVASAVLLCCSLKLIAVLRFQNFVNLLVCFLLPRRARGTVGTCCVAWWLGSSYGVLLNLGGKIFGIGFHCAIFLIFIFKVRKGTSLMVWWWDTGLLFGRGTKIPHATGQLSPLSAIRSPWATTRKSVCHTKVPVQAINQLILSHIKLWRHLTVQ